MKRLTANLAAALLLAAFSQSCDRPGPALASVNGRVITAADLDAQWAVLKTVRPGLEADSKARDQLLDQMVRQSLLEQEAENRGFHLDPSFRQAVDSQRAALRAELEKQISDARAQLARLDQAVRGKALVDALVADYAAGHAVGAAQVKDYYRDQAQKGQDLPPLEQVEEQIRRQILLDALVSRARERHEITVDRQALSDYAPPRP